jgi:hypothetical protein
MIKIVQKDDKLFAFLGTGVFKLIDLINQNIKEEGTSI